jgi:hypothetical protein
MKERTAKIITILLSVLLLSAVMVVKPNLAGAQLPTGPSSPAAAYDPNSNRYLVVYQNVQYVEPDYLYSIYGQFVRLDGTLAGDAFPISEAGNSHHGPSIARGSDGRFLVVWDASDDPEAPVLIVGQFVNPDGTLDGTNFTISDAVGFKMRPKVASAPDYTRFLVVWFDNRNWETSGDDIYGQLVDEDGTLVETTIGSNFAVTNANESQFEAAVAYDSTNGRFLVAWQDFRGLANYDIYGQLVNADWGGEPARGSHYLTDSDVNFPISTEATEYQYLPALAFDDVNNRFLVVWADNRNWETSGDDIYGQLVNGYFDGFGDVLNYYGTAPDVNFLILDGATGIGDISIAKDDCNSAFMMAWPDSRSTTNIDIYGALLNADGSVRDADFAVSQSANDKFFPSVAVNGQCGALVAFEEQAPSANILGLATTGEVPYTKVTLLQPNGGESFATGELVNITWGAPATAVKFKLFYSVDNGVTWVKMTPDFVSEKSYPWTVPSLTANKKSCRVKVVGYKNNGLLVGSDKSDTSFSIEVVKLTYPNGTETLYSGDPVTLIWTVNVTKKPVASVKLYYTKNNGITWIPIETLKPITTTPNSFIVPVWPSGDYGWTVPDVPGPKTKCKVKVVLKSATGATLGSDVSDAVFTITNGI